jgi:hypothetical protein
MMKAFPALAAAATAVAHAMPAEAQQKVVFWPARGPLRAPSSILDCVNGWRVYSV